MTTDIQAISVQLVHIQGPLKGEIQDFPNDEIFIGRHPDCQVNFPKDLVTLSRIHAKIVREGNRFKLVDQSTNGTFVNGRKILEVYLKDGDVVMFAEGGPKLSFLTQASSPTDRKRTTRAGMASPQCETPVRQAKCADASAPAEEKKAVRQPPPPSPEATPAVAPVTAKAPFAIQYGTAIKSFQTLPIVIGSSQECDFAIDHPALHERHAQIYFSDDQYWIKDLTGTGFSIDGRAVSVPTALEPDMQIALTSRGPTFRFLCGGRLAEVEEPRPEPPQPAEESESEVQSPVQSPKGLGRIAGSLLKKFFSH